MSITLSICYRLKLIYICKRNVCLPRKEKLKMCVTYGIKKSNRVKLHKQSQGYTFKLSNGKKKQQQKQLIHLNVYNVGVEIEPKKKERERCKRDNGMENGKSETRILPSVILISWIFGPDFPVYNG